MSDLNQANILLSASFPSGERGDRFKPYDPSGISDAVSAFARAVLSNNGRLTFGGHPTITPLVLMIAREIQIKDSVTVFHSAWFQDMQIPEVEEIRDEQLGYVEWTPSATNQEESLQIMRNAMIQRRRYASALFIGGMEGIVEEYEMVKGISPETPCVPVAGPGGAATNLPTNDCERLELGAFQNSRSYPYMALQFVDAISRSTSAMGRAGVIVPPSF